MKEINFEYEGKDYTLSFTRKTVDGLANRGFDIDAASTSKATIMLPMFFHGAFLAKHPMIKQDVTNKILKKFTNKENLWAMLGEMYVDAINTLLAEPDEDAEGNVSWEANWEKDKDED